MRCDLGPVAADRLSRSRRLVELERGTQVVFLASQLDEAISTESEWLSWLLIANTATGRYVCYCIRGSHQIAPLIRAARHTFAAIDEPQLIHCLKPKNV